MSFIKKRLADSFNISFIRIIKINGHLLVRCFLLKRCLRDCSIIYDLYQGVISRQFIFT